MIFLDKYGCESKPETAGRSLEMKVVWVDVKVEDYETEVGRPETKVGRLDGKLGGFEVEVGGLEGGERYLKVL